MEKSKLRNEYIAKRDNFELSLAKNASKVIANKLLSHPMVNRKENILVYIPFRHEVDIRPFIEKAWDLKKNILVPKTIKASKQMDIYRIFSWEDLNLGNYGILEPFKEVGRFSSEAVELVLVPGVAFDRQGYRLGYGGGFYDRFFEVIDKPYRIGIAYDFQIVDKLPIDEHDFPMDEVITEARDMKR